MVFNYDNKNVRYCHHLNHPNKLFNQEIFDTFTPKIKEEKYFWKNYILKKRCDGKSEKPVCLWLNWITTNSVLCQTEGG